MTSPSPHSLLIRASAGTGKTFRLSNHYLAQFVRGTDPEVILATTFTKKAAGEIQVRLFQRLMEAAGSDTDAAELGQHLGVFLNADRAANELHRLARNMHRIRVSTLDAFYAKLATAYSLEFGLSADWAILDDVDVLPLKLRALDDLLSAGDTNDTVALLHLLDKGESKRRVVGQMLDAVNKFHDVYLNAGRRYEPWDRVSEPVLTSNEAIEDAVATLRSEASEFPHKTGAASILKLADDVVAEQWREVVGSTFSQRVADGSRTYNGKPFPDSLCEAVSVVAHAAAGRLLLELRAQNQATFELLHRFDRVFSSRKQQSGGLTFTDVTRHLANAIRSFDGGDIGFRLDGEIEHLLLDEFQDTSLPQWDILQPIAQRTISTDRNTVFCVGDVKQAIYGWRGGVAAIFDRVERELSIDSDSMDASYRSSQVVIDVVNRLFGNLTHHADYSAPDRKAVSIWHERYREHKAARDQPGYAEVRCTAKPASGSAKFGPDVRRWTAGFVRDLCQQHPGRSIGVLTRQNEIASEIVAHLRGLGINASDEGREKLADSAAVQLLVSLFTLAESPHDQAARFHIATSSLTVPAELADHDDDAAAARLSQRLREAFIDDGFAATVHHWASHLVAESGPRDIARMRQLVALADEYDRVTSPSAGEYLRVVEEKRANDPVPGPVRVMTVHQSKGLEFDIVVLTELDSPCYRMEKSGFVAARPAPDQPPDRIMRYRSSNEVSWFPDGVREVFDEAATAEMAEALCRFYVAVTRAQSAVYFLVAPTPKSGSSSSSSSFSQLVRSILCNGRAFTADEVVESFGEPGWDHSSADTAKTIPSRRTANIGLGPSAAGTLRDRRTITPSSLAHPEEDSKTTRRLHGIGDGTAAIRGTLVHRWMEELEWLERSPQLSAARRLELAHWLDVPPKIAEEENARFDAVLGSQMVTRLLTKSLYEAALERSVLRVHRELPFSVLSGDEIITGTIDRLVLFASTDENAAADTVVAAEIIDWKTDFVEDDEHLASKVAMYRKQLSAYADAVSDLFHIDRASVSGRLAFLSIDRDIAFELQSPTTRNGGDSIDSKFAHRGSTSVVSAHQSTLFDDELPGER